jgi:rubrerythrin
VTAKNPNQTGANGLIHVDVGLDLPHLPEGHAIHRILSSKLWGIPSEVETGDLKESFSFWGAESYRLNRVRFFQEASEEKKQRILHKINVEQLREAYFIEKSGLAYGAKMLLLSTTTEERMLYASFASDESQHLAAVGAFLKTDDKAVTTNPFHTLLADLIQGGDFLALILTIQVVLEGWGLSHYRSLAASCKHPVLAQTFRRILEDEARHHGSGRVMVQERSFDPQTMEQCLLATHEILNLVRLGPQMVVGALEEELGGLSSAQKKTVLTELDCMSHSRERLMVLKSLLSSENTQWLVEQCMERNLFEPLPIEQTLCN